MEIREELERDRQGVFEVVIATFGGTREAELIQSLDNEGLVLSSLVAVEYGEIVAHALVSEVEMASADTNISIRAAILTPVCVAPTHQHMGIGAELVRQSLEKCEEKGVEAIFAMGAERFFARFGFTSEYQNCIKPSISAAEMSVLPLKQGVFENIEGIVTLPPAFG